MSYNQYKFTEDSEYIEKFSVQENGNEVILVYDKSKNQDATENISERVVEKLNFLQDPANEFIDELPHSSVSGPSSLQRPAAIEKASDVGDWSRGEIVFKTRKYEEYIHCVGKGKKFKNKNNMWTTIADELNYKFNGQKSPFQCRTKFSNDFEAFKNKQEEREKTKLLSNFEEEINAIESLNEDIVELEAKRSLTLDVDDEENYKILALEVGRKTKIAVDAIIAQVKERIYREQMNVKKELKERFVGATQNCIKEFMTESEENSS